MYDYGARHYDPSLGRFFKIDRFAEKYFEMTPYQYAANNPMYYVDINGDSINVAPIQKYDQRNGTNYLDQITNDLSEQTGLTYSVNENGQLVYAANEGGDAIISLTIDSDGNIVEQGSQEARDIMTDAISNTTTAYSRITSGRSSSVVGGGLININPNQISGMMNGANNINPKTLGMGMTFMHETLHSALGGGLRDAPRGSGVGATGDVVDRMNVVRSEMNAQGNNYGIRKSYPTGYVPIGTSHYLPFSSGALKNLQNGYYPNTMQKYLKFK